MEPCSLGAPRTRLPNKSPFSGSHFSCVRDVGREIARNSLAFAFHSIRFFIFSSTFPCSPRRPPVDPRRSRGPFRIPRGVLHLRPRSGPSSVRRQLEQSTPVETSELATFPPTHIQSPLCLFWHTIALLISPSLYSRLMLILPSLPLRNALLLYAPIV